MAYAVYERTLSAQTLLCLMMIFQQLILFVAAISSVAFANDDIQFECGKGTVLVKWTVGPELVPNAPRLLLGRCMPSNFSPLPDGGGEAVFHYNFKDCGFKVQMTEDEVIYQSTVGYRPKAKPHPAAISFPIECAYKRTKGWTAPFLNPGYASVEGQGQLSFHMMLLNEHFTGPAQSNSFPLGSFIPVWASVEQGGHQPLLLLLDECVASTSMVLEPMTPVHPIITNHGCLDDGKNGNSQFLPRYQTSEVILHLQAFRFALNEHIYIHCKLVAWDPQSFDEGKKMCNFIKQLGGWELMDDPSKSALCNCCDSVCTRRRKRDVDSGLVQNAVVGPIIITEN